MFFTGDQRFRLHQTACIAFATLAAAFAFLALAAPRALADPGDVVITSPVGGDTYSDSSSAPQLEFDSIGDVAHQSCKLDNSAYVECYRYGYGGVLLPNGVHSYSVRTVDTDGDIDVQAVGFTIADSDAPTISAAVAPNASDIVEDPVTSELALDLSTSDEHARIYASIDDQGDDRADAYGPVFRWYPENVSNGTHTAHFLALDGAGNASTTSVIFSVNDTTAPTVTITKPTASEVLSTGDFFAEFDSSDVAATYTCRIDSAPGLPCSPGSTLQISNVATGTHAFKVTASDNAGNTSTTSQSFSVTDAPVAGLTLAAPANGAAYTAQPVLAFTTVDPIEPSSLQCSANGGIFKRCDEGSPIDAIDHNGSWTLKVRAKNASGDQVSATSSFTINDTTPPTITGSNPGTVANIADFLPDIIVEDEFANGDWSYTLNAICQINSGPPTDCVDLLLYNPEPAFTSGPTTLKLTASDWVGNPRSVTFSFEIADTTPPDLQIVSPTDGFNLTTDATTVDFVAGSDAIKLECQINSGPRQSCSAGANDGYMSWTPSGLPSGSVALHVYATDNAGNTSTDVVTINNVDVTGPSLSFITPDIGAAFSDKVVARVLSGEQIFKLRCGVGATAAALASDATDCWISQHDNHTATFRPSVIAPGVQTLWVEASDNQGNATVISRSITVNDTLAPDLFFDGFNLDGGETTFDSPETLGYSSSDPSAHFTCALDDAPAAPCGSGGYGTLDLLPSANVSHTIVVQAIDPAGNTTQKSIAYTVNDTLPPELRVHGVFDGQAVNASATAAFSTRGATITECAVDSAPFAACVGSGWTASFASSGAHTLKIRAADAAGNTTLKTFSVVATVPTSPVDPPSNPSAPPAPPAPPAPTLPSATASIASLKAKVTKKAVTIPVTVNVKLPAGVVAKSTCTGKASISLAVGKKILKNVSAAMKLVKNKCTITTSLKLKPKAVAGKKFSVSVTFAGNAAIAKFYSARSGKSGRAK